MCVCFCRLFLSFVIVCCQYFMTGYLSCREFGIDLAVFIFISRYIYVPVDSIKQLICKKVLFNFSVWIYPRFLVPRWLYGPIFLVYRHHFIKNICHKFGFWDMIIFFGGSAVRILLLIFIEISNYCLRVQCFCRFNVITWEICTDVPSHRLWVNSSRDSWRFSCWLS